MITKETTQSGGFFFGVPERYPPVIHLLLAHTARRLDGYASPAAENAHFGVYFTRLCEKL